MTKLTDYLRTALPHQSRFASSCTDTIAISGNDQVAKDKVSELISAIGLNPLDVGDLSLAPAVEGMGLMYVAPGYQERTRFEFHLRPR